MRIKILMVRDVDADLLPEADILKERGFLLYTTAADSLDDMIRELKPDVVFINVLNGGLAGNDVYNKLLNNKEFADIPVIYTLSEDDVYLVNRKRSQPKSSRNLMTDNIIDGIKAALNTGVVNNKRQLSISRHFHYPNYAGRA